VKGGKAKTSAAVNMCSRRTAPRGGRSGCADVSCNRAGWNAHGEAARRLPH
jgi:hypothetical protein